MNHKNQSSDIFPLFNTFWNNTGLRGTVFPLREFPGDNTDALEDFKALVNNTSSGSQEISGD